MNKAILVDPFARTISTVKVGDYTDIQKHVGCDCFTTVRFDERNTAFVDDEGLINGTERAVRFVDEVYPQPLPLDIVPSTQSSLEGILCYLHNVVFSFFQSLHLFLVKVIHTIPES